MNAGWQRAMVPGVFAVLILATLTGCSTVMTMKGTGITWYNEDAIVPFGIYSGTRRNVYFFGPEGTVLNAILATFDFPGSLIFDTIMLPFSIPWDLLTDPKPRGKGGSRQ